MTQETDLIAYLTGKGMKTYRASGEEITAHCWWCLDGDPKGKGKLYLNTESWLYQCKRCDSSGGRKSLLEHFGDDDELQHVAGSDPTIRRRILTEAANLAHEMLLGNELMLARLLDRGLAPEIIAERKFGYVPSNVGLSEMLPCRGDVTFKDLIGAGILTVSGREFFNDSITIPYWQHGTCVQIREKQPDGKYRTTTGDRVRLYNADALLGADEVLITEGEFDCDAVLSAIAKSNDRKLQAMAVVGLPGAGSWPEGLVEMLGEAKRVFIGLDPDETGKAYAVKLKEALGNKARIVELPDQLPKCDWTDYLKAKTKTNPHGGHSWADVRDLLIEADLTGKRMFTIADAAAKWQRRRTESPGLQLGWPSLDSTLRPGIKPGQIVIPLAKSGTGKTVFLSNIAHNTRSRYTLYVSLEMTATEVYEHLRRIHRFHFPHAPASQAVLDYSRLMIVDQNRIGRGDLREYIREYTETVGHRPELVILDYLQYYARGFRGGSMYEKVSDAAMDLKAVAKEEAVALICPSQVNRGAEHGKPMTADDARDSGVIDETGDFVLSLFRPDQVINKDDPNNPMVPANGGFKVQVLKSRHGGKGRVFDLRMSLMSLVIVDVVFDRKNAARVDQENSLHRQGVHYDDYRTQHEEAVSQRAFAL